MKNTSEMKIRKRKPCSHHDKSTPEYHEWIMRKRIGALKAWQNPQKRGNISNGRWGKIRVKHND